MTSTHWGAPLSLLAVVIVQVFLSSSSYWDPFCFLRFQFCKLFSLDIHLSTSRVYVEFLWAGQKSSAYSTACSFQMLRLKQAINQYSIQPQRSWQKIVFLPLYRGLFGLFPAHGKCEKFVFLVIGVCTRSLGSVTPRSAENVAAYGAIFLRRRNKTLKAFFPCAERTQNDQQCLLTNSWKRGYVDSPTNVA